jgi:uncharacterized integral membrane protein
MKARMIRTAVLAVAATILILLALALFAAAATVALRPYMGPWQAPLAVGGGCLLLALVAGLIARALATPQRRPLPAPARHPIVASSDGLAQQTRPLLLVGGALVVGYLAGRRLFD